MSSEVWKIPGVWLIPENSKEAVELSGQKKGHIKNNLHFHLQDVQGYECVFYKLVYYAIRETEKSLKPSKQGLGLKKLRERELGL